MKPPPWVEVQLAKEHGPDCVEPEGTHIHMLLRVKRWHPGFWLFIVRYWLGLEPTYR